MIIHISCEHFRLQGEDYRMTSVTFAPRAGVKHVPMLKVHNPFAFNLKSSQQHHQTINGIA